MEQTKLEIAFEMQENHLIKEINRQIETLSKYNILDKNIQLSGILNISQELTRNVSALMALQETKFWANQSES